MFGWRKRKAAPSPDASVREHPLRPLLFGDLSLDTYPANDGGEPWASFAGAAGRLQRGDTAGARDLLLGVLRRPALESRQYLQAWHALRALGAVPPPEEAKRVYGVVVDVPVSGGTDTLAAYEDHSARYLNVSGSAVVWERPDSSLNAAVDALLHAGRTLVQQVGPWEGARPALPPRQARISLLTPSGLHFGQAPFDVLRIDPMAAPIIEAATALMLALITKSKVPPPGSTA